MSDLLIGNLFITGYNPGDDLFLVEYVVAILVEVVVKSTIL